MMLGLHHPNLVSAVHIITQEKPCAVVLEYLDRGSFSDWLQSGETHSNEDLIFILHQVACGMAELAKKGIGRSFVRRGLRGACLNILFRLSILTIVHRDLAARNVLLRVQDVRFS